MKGLNYPSRVRCEVFAGGLNQEGEGGCRLVGKLSNNALKIVQRRTNS